MVDFTSRNPGKIKKYRLCSHAKDKKFQSITDQRRNLQHIGIAIKLLQINVSVDHLTSFYDEISRLLRRFDHCRAENKRKLITNWNKTENGQKTAHIDTQKFTAHKNVCEFQWHCVCLDLARNRQTSCLPIGQCAGVMAARKITECAGGGRYKCTLLDDK